MKKKEDFKAPQRVIHVFESLEKLYPNAETELTYENPFQLLVAVILSAQCTDARVNLTTPALFKKFSTPEKMSKAPLEEIEKLIHSCGFYKNKAKSIIGMSTKLLSDFKGKMPQTIEELIQLPGVGRKTASVILNQAFDLPAIAVDTHVARVSHRLGWTDHTDPHKIEIDLKNLLPENKWSIINGTLILHGRRICKARKPLCVACPLRSDCRYFVTLVKGP